MSFHQRASANDITSVQMKAIKRLSKSPPSPMRSNKPCALVLSVCPFHSPHRPQCNHPPHPPKSYRCSTVNPPSLLLPLPSWCPPGRMGGTRERGATCPATHNTKQAINFGLTCICSSLGHMQTWATTPPSHHLPPITAGKLKGGGVGWRD